MSRRDHGGVRRLLLGVLLACSGLAACGGEPGAPANPPRVPFEQDDEAVRVTRGIREALAQGTRPASPEVQRFKAVALRHVGEPFVEEALLALLPALKDWEGLALYFQAKPSLTPDEEKLLARFGREWLDAIGNCIVTVQHPAWHFKDIPEAFRAAELPDRLPEARGTGRSYDDFHAEVDALDLELAAREARIELQRRIGGEL